MRCDAISPIQTDAYGPMLFRCCPCLYKKIRSMFDYKPMRRSGYGPMRCGVYGSMRFLFVQTICSPNEDFGRMNKRRNDGFRLTFQRFVAQIEYSHQRKSASKIRISSLFIFPNSSFGEHKLVSHMAYGPMRFFFVPKDQFDYKLMRRGALL